MPWVSQGAVVIGTTALPQQSGLSGTLTNTSHLLVDVEATCLAGRSISYDVTTDASATIRFTDGRTLQLDAGRNVGQVA